MDHIKIIKKVALTLKYKAEIPNLVKQIKKVDPKNRVKVIEQFKEKFLLSDKQYSELLESLIKSYQIHLLGEDFKKDLKKITETRPVATYFDLRY